MLEEPPNQCWRNHLLWVLEEHAGPARQPVRGYSGQVWRVVGRVARGHWWCVSCWGERRRER